jgi:ABC-2 type transport system permease protein
MRWSIISAVVQRELREVASNRLLVIGIVIPPIALVTFPLLLGVLLPSQPLPDSFRVQILAQRPDWHRLPDRALTGAFTVQQFLPYFLLMPAYVPLAIATYSIIGEKQSRSLEAVLATPIRTQELLAGKTLAALTPGVLTGWLTYGVFFALASLTYGPDVIGVITDGSWLAGVFVLGPAIGLASTVAGVLVSSRVSDPRVGQQIGGVIIVPLVAVGILQATGTVLVGTSGYLSLALVVGALGLVGLRLGAWLFARETILTRWK